MVKRICKNHSVRSLHKSLSGMNQYRQIRLYSGVGYSLAIRVAVKWDAKVHHFIELDVFLSLEGFSFDNVGVYGFPRYI